MDEIEQILRVAVARNATDVHIQAGVPPVLRIDKELVALEGAALDTLGAEQLILPIMGEAQRKAFSERLEVDFSYRLSDAARFRVNVFRERGAIAGAFRRIPLEIPTPEAIGLPRAVIELAQLRRGFVLFTGAAGQGKSTSLAALLDRINRDRRAHIITLEDPVEYVFEHRASVVVQRELGQDMLSFDAALRSALREDPDVILVGEMRDPATMAAALTAAETGPLVFATLHTPSAVQSVDRIVDAFPPHQQAQTRIQLANVLKAVVNQQLLVRRDRPGYCLAVELLLASPGIRNLIREAKTFQIQSMMQAGGGVGMTTMEAALKSLRDRGMITSEDAMDHALDEREMARLLGR